MSDLIERQKAIDAIHCDITVTGKQNAELVASTIGAFVDRIKALPSAQPEQRWILCDEIMPEEHEWIGTKQFGTTMSDEVYVTFENSKGERFTKHLHFHNGDLSRYDKTHMDAWFKKDYKPIAWMPLPEPYKGEQHG